MDNNQILERARYKGGERFHTEGALHLTADGRAVDETDPAGRFVLVGPGGDIPLPLAEELGLTSKDKNPKATEEEKAGVKEPEPKPETVEIVKAEEPEKEVGTVSEEASEQKVEQDKPEEKAVHKAQVSDKAIHKAHHK